MLKSDAIPALGLALVAFVILIAAEWHIAKQIAWESAHGARFGSAQGARGQ